MQNSFSRKRPKSGDSNSTAGTDTWTRDGPYQIFGQAWAITLTICILTGFLLTSIYGFSNGGVPQLSSATILGGACLCLGGLLGFLFAIPRYFAHDAAIKTASSSDSLVFRYDPNDNLVQISDWLTKILVGVGLTQLTKLPAFLDSFGEYFGPSVGNNAKSVSIAILLFFSVSGFLLGYIWTRIYFAGELYKAEKENKETISGLVQIDRRMKVDNLYMVAVNAEQNGDYHRAEMYFKEVIEVDRENIKAKASLADLYVTWDQSPDRREKLQKALELCLQCESSEDLTEAVKGGILLIHAAACAELADFPNCAKRLESAITTLKASGAADNRILSYIQANKKLVDASKRDKRVATLLGDLNSGS